MISNSSLNSLEFRHRCDFVVRHLRWWHLFWFQNMYHQLNWVSTQQCKDSCFLKVGILFRKYHLHQRWWIFIHIGILSFKLWWLCSLMVLQIGNLQSFQQLKCLYFYSSVDKLAYQLFQWHLVQLSVYINQ